MPQLLLNSPLAHQLPIDGSASRWKVWRGGRRSGKTEWAAKAATDGHGPRVRNVPLFPGLIQGKDVAWIVRDYTQFDIFWHEFVEPTFGGFARINKADKTVRLPTGGTLWAKSSENIASIRGLGSNLGGVIFEEAAYYPTMEAFRREIRPMLMDNKGWGAWISSTKAGSEFNQLCQEVIDGTRRADDGWEHFHTTPYDNPCLDPDEIKALLKEYETQGKDALAEEVFAELLEGGAGLAFPEWRTDLHTTSIWPIPESWEITAGMDWGYSPDDGVIVMCAHGPAHRQHLFYEYVFSETVPNKVGQQFARDCFAMGLYPREMWFDPSMDKMDRGGPTILDEVMEGWRSVLPSVQLSTAAAPTGRRGPRGETSRETGKLLFHKLLAYKADEAGIVHPWGMPMFTVDPRRAPRFAKMMPKLKRDEKRPSDVATTGQWEHGYDAGRYIQMGRTPYVAGPPEVIPDDVHPGFIPGTTERRSRIRSEETELLEEIRSLEVQGKAPRGRYRRV